MKIEFEDSDIVRVSLQEISTGSLFSSVSSLDLVRMRTNMGYVTLDNGEHREDPATAIREYVVREGTLSIERINTGN